MIFYTLAPEAKADLRQILQWSQVEFGQAAMERYNRLLFLAFEALSANQLPAGVRFFNEELKLFHLKGTSKYLLLPSTCPFFLYLRLRRILGITKEPPRIVFSLAEKKIASLLPKIRFLEIPLNIFPKKRQQKQG